MQKSGNQSRAKAAHRKVMSSTTLDRKYVKRPTRCTEDVMVVNRSPMVSRFGDVTQAEPIVQQELMMAPEQHPMQKSANEKMSRRMLKKSAQQPQKMSAQELKEQAIKKALASAEKTVESSKNQKSKKTKASGGEKLHFGFGRVMLALSCAAAAVFVIAYFVNLNMPDISLRVAAMQTGIEASYPNYVPRDFSLSDITSENGKITLNFKNASTGDAFSLVEEQSSWDSSALLTNYVKDAYGENYSTIREQGLTLYMSDRDACWVNGGVVYKLTTTSGSLTKKQIKSIAVSL